MLGRDVTIPWWHTSITVTILCNELFSQTLLALLFLFRYQAHEISFSFLPIFALATHLLFLAFMLAPTNGDRIGLGVGAFFASVANSYINLQELPGVGLVTLTDMVNGIGMITIMLTLFGTIISSYLAEAKGDVASARIFDHVSLFVFTIGFIAANVMITISAAL